ncbi:MAG: glycerophosphodiester phosphodiesterase family protein [Pseudomonadota bacterium]
MLRIAHRGLWGPGVPENSLAAFQAAAANGFGVELDVHLTKDEVPIVFHDANLNRMTGEQGYIFETTFEEAQRLSLGGDQMQAPPSLAQTLSSLPKTSPILVEVKTPHRDSPHDEVKTATKVLDVIKATLPSACCMSFSTIITNEIAGTLHASQIGYLADEGDSRPVQAVRDTGSGFAAVWRDDVEQARAIIGEDGPQLYTWTIKSQDQQSAVKPYVDGVIFEGF